jgi:hypothetical protein
MWEPQPLATLRASTACTGIKILPSIAYSCLFLRRFFDQYLNDSLFSLSNILFSIIILKISGDPPDLPEKETERDPENNSKQNTLVQYYVSVSRFNMNAH